MSCSRSLERVDWARLLRHRARSVGASADGSTASAVETTGDAAETWRHLAPHLEECETCRRHAYALDPSLVFQRLPRAEVDADDVADMKRRVAVLRSARELEADSRRRGFDWRRALLGGVAAMLLVLLGVGHGPRSEPAPSPVPTVTVGGTLGPGPLDESVADRPLIEDLDLPAAQVVQWSRDDVSMVLVVDKRLDV